MAVDWQAVREQFPALTGWTYLNTATYGQLPRRATEAVARHFSRRDELACGDFMSWFDDMDVIRTNIGRLIDCSADDVAFITNAATALSLFLGGIEWRSGDRIVVLENEFPNNIYYAALLAERGVELVEASWADFYEAVTPATRAVLMSTASYITGFTPPLAEIGQFLRRRGVLFYVDGTQSVGGMQFNVREIEPDLLAVNAYKWMVSPNGAGYMYVRPELRQILRPAVIGWRSDRGWREVNALSHGAPEFSDRAEQYEGGMLNFPSLYAMGASVELFLEIGPAAIETRLLELAASLCSALRACGGEIRHERTPIVAAKFPQVDVSRLAKALADRRILVSARHGHLRASMHLYNNEDDIRVLATNVAELLEDPRRIQ